MSWYKVLVLDSEGAELSCTEESSLKQAKRSATDKLLHENYSDAYKAEVRNEADVCVWDRFRPAEAS